MTYEDEQREEHERELDKLECDRVQDAVAYTERENANLLKAVERLEKEKTALVEALEMIANAKGVFAHELSTMAKDALFAEANKTVGRIKCLHIE